MISRDLSRSSGSRDGAFDLDDFRFLSLTEVTTIQAFYARDMFSAEDRAQLSRLLAVAEYSGTDDRFAIDLATGRVCRCGHDPVGFSLWLPSLDMLVRVALVSIASGYYGFPSAYVAELVSNAKIAMCGFDL